MLEVRTRPGMSGALGAIPGKSIQAQLEKILSSPVFLTAESLSRFLRYIVEQSVLGQGGSLKESVLGIEVFGRGKSFDPRLDPIVRVDARRLRAKLTEYYLEEGQGDAVIIEVKKGSYVPVFHQRENASVAPPELVRNHVSAPVPDLSSIIVLPFVNLSADPENEYFSDGLTQEVIATLARIPGLRVIARSTAFRYQGKAQDIGKIGAELKVGAVLEGSVRRTGNRLRIAAQLIDVSTCFHVWSETFEREVKDIFAIQQEISDAIGSMVRVQIPGASLPVVRDYSDNVEAYDLYLRGIHFERKRTADALGLSLDYLQQAAMMDPQCAPIFSAACEFVYLSGRVRAGKSNRCDEESEDRCGESVGDRRDAGGGARRPGHGERALRLGLAGRPRRISPRAGTQSRYCRDPLSLREFLPDADGPRRSGFAGSPAGKESRSLSPCCSVPRSALCSVGLGNATQRSVVVRKPWRWSRTTYSPTYTFHGLACEKGIWRRLSRLRKRPYDWRREPHSRSAASGLFTQ